MIRSLVFCLVHLSFTVAYGQNVKKSNAFIQSIEKGTVIYEDFCMNCHMADGKGIEKITPPLAMSDYLKNNRIESIKAVKFGQSGELVVNGKNYNGTMTSMGLSDDEIADVMNYITTNFGNTNQKMFTEEEVLKIEE